MRSGAETQRAGRGWPRRRGVISGYVWKLIREQVGMTQVQLAEELDVDVTTVQGWESGRRPLPAVSSGQMVRFRIRLIRAGAHPRLFSVLSDAFEADVVIDEAIACGNRVANSRHHPLSVTVHRRDLTNLITWPLTGFMPTQLVTFNQPEPVRRGPVASHPVLGADERSRLFEHLLAVADAHRADEDYLLRRQAIYLLAFDDDPRTRQWLTDEHTRAMRLAGRIDDIPSWILVRSSAVALTRSGDRDPLLAFVATGLSDDDQELANLNYWAYWVGEMREVCTDDGFMRDLRAQWDGIQLLTHLIERLHPSADQFELYVHTLWQLLLARPSMFDRRPALRSQAATRVSEALDSAGLTVRARRELSNIAYATKIGDR